jgi:transposase InsO family protein
MIRHRSCRPPEVALRAKLRDLANERRCFGYRRLFILLRRDGEPSGVNRIYRLYREEGLSVRKRKARRRAVGTRAPILVEAKANARWSLDFVHDQFACGRRFRVPMWSTMSHANAWRRSRTRQSRVAVSREN